MRRFLMFCLPSLVAAWAASIAASGQPTGTPWAVPGTLATGSVPWTVYTTVVTTNSHNSLFPSLCYDWSRNRMLGTYIDSNDHYCTNGTVHLVESRDGGATWTNDTRLDLFPGHGICAAHLTALSDGSLLLKFSARDYPNGEKRNATFWPTIVLRSTDGVTWKTNSVLPRGYFSQGPVFETSVGTWLLPLYSRPGPYHAFVARSTDRGTHWSLVPLDAAANESMVAQAPNGSLLALARLENSPPHILISTNDGAAWSLVGTAGLGNAWFASFPAFCFCGQRLLLAGRENPFGQSAFFYSDTYPYTRGWKVVDRGPFPSLYDFPVKLSDSVVLWLSAFDDSRNLLTSGKTNAWLEAWITANDGAGWNHVFAAPPRPAVALYRQDLSAVGRITVWTNRGSLGVSPTNSALNGAIPIRVSSGSSERFAWCQGLTNVHFSSTTLPFLWRTNRCTILWRAARTNGANDCMVLDDNDARASASTGFSLRMYGASVRVEVANSTRANVAQYLGNADSDYLSGMPHVHAIRLSNEQMWSFLDGNYAARNVATNAGGSKYYSASPAAGYSLTVGALASSTAGVPIFLSDVLVFTNVLSDREIYEWMLRLKYGEQGAAFTPTHVPPLDSPTRSSVSGRANPPSIRHSPRSSILADGSSRRRFRPFNP